MNYGPEATAEGVPEQNLRQVMDELVQAANYLHERMDEVEDRLLGSRPRPMGIAANSLNTPPAPPPGVFAQANTTAGRITDLHNRFSKLLSQI